MPRSRSVAAALALSTATATAIAATAIAATAAAATAAAAEPPCLTPAELAAAARFAMPEAIAATGARCAAVLPPDAFLRREGDALAARYAQGADDAWPTVRTALLRVAPGSDNYAGALVRQTPEGQLKTFVRGAVASGVTSQLPLARCATVNTLMQLLAPLPADSTATVIATIVGLAATRTHRLGPIAVCPA